MATLTLRRDAGWADKIRDYRIIIDGAEVGRLREGAELRCSVGSGQHVLEARIDWCGSKRLHLDVGSGDLVVFVRSALRGWRVFLSLYYALFDRRGWLKVELKEPAAV